MTEGRIGKQGERRNGEKVNRELSRKEHKEINQQLRRATDRAKESWREGASGSVETTQEES